ncbi:carboxypeptidase-like regulatory domain-containing protein [Mucilaginibacter humi]|uniref:carboxypeptidase-like regulatory domain-containing protein n=1 Tax=Mucilaginibacter humi TaxID=2732510 RepID=UPI001FE93BCF|nr:TonB-dependent receptor [Mucilaginibacter humi]
MKKLLMALFALLLPVPASAQFSVTGTVINNSSKRPLPGATISVAGHPIQTSADEDGKFQVTLPGSGTFIINATYLGYHPVSDTIHLNGGNKISIVFKLAENTFLTEEVTVNATRASANSPTAFTNLNKKDIGKNNSGRGFEYLLEQTPSTVVTSNAGTGVGYTSIRIRGSDPTRINVTLNGIPMNDAEDQGVYFVDLPDLASSVDNIRCSAAWVHQLMARGLLVVVSTYKLPPGAIALMRSTMARPDHTVL